MQLQDKAQIEQWHDAISLEMLSMGYDQRYIRKTLSKFDNKFLEIIKNIPNEIPKEDLPTLHERLQG